ncbi:DegQ family serine endoprotease [Ectothiorhodospiraceae bacterium WFHF3C12]|nr:DegQ family serine endoprotease [Ectothiorhodospiraceae bacterium WFHF3C12]
MQTVLKRILPVAALLLALAGHGATAALPDAAVGEDGNVPSLAPLVERVSPAVVNIATKGTVEMEQHPLMQHPFFRKFFDAPEQPRERQVQSLGSGVIIDAEEGYIVTNHHVIAKADEIRVGLNDDREFDAEVIGSDPETDLAVIRIDADNLSSVEIGDSDTLRAGDYVVALGNPFGLEHTVTSGIVSGKGRSLSGRMSEVRIQDFIQTDASINPGNSGGALVNLHGELVGINTAILSRSGGNIGIGFAVPVNMATTVVDQLIEHGEVRRGLLGVRVQDLTSEIAEAMELEAKDGALIAQVTPDSAADKAGLREGDVVVTANGEPVEDGSELAKIVGLMQIGDTVELEIIRDGERKTVTATVAESDARTVSGSGVIQQGPVQGAKISQLDERSPLHGKVEGVLVVGVKSNSPAAQYLQPGDVITSVNRQPVDSPTTFQQAAEGHDRLLLHIRRGNAALFVVAK